MTLGIEREALTEPLRSFGRPVFGTCAGLIVLDREHLGMMDIEAQRNAFGRQVRSFEADLDITGLDGPPLRAVFIRAPWIAEYGDDVQIVAEVDGHPVAAQQGDILAVAFHPELGTDTRLHERFLASCNGAARG
jgi:5'-phosphate synthase pdxT subunit